MSHSRPHWNSLFRVRVHAWIAVVSSTLAWPLWMNFCHKYVQGQGDEYNALVCVLKEAATGSNSSSATAQALATKLAKQLGDAKVDDLKDTCTDSSGKKLKDNLTKGGAQVTEKIAKLLLKAEFGVTNVNLTSVTVSSTNKVFVLISQHFNKLVDKLAQQVSTKLGSGGTSAEEAAGKIRDALVAAQTEITALVNQDFGISTEQEVQVQKSDDTVTVTIGSGKDPKGSATVNVKGSEQKEIKIIVKGNPSVVTTEKAKQIASTIALALVSEEVKDAAKANQVMLSLPSPESIKIGSQATVTVKKTGSATVEFKVTGVKSESQAKRIAYKLGSALSDDKVTKAATGYTISGPDKINADVTNSLSALCMFPLGAFTEDFMYPGLLPYAFLDPQNANLINYTMPLFYMTGAVFVLLVNDVFHPTGFAKDPSLDSWFKDWSEGESPGSGWSYHYMWLLHVPILIVFVLCFMTIHGIWNPYNLLMFPNISYLESIVHTTLCYFYI